MTGLPTTAKSSAIVDMGSPVVLFALGGTISMAGGDGNGIAPKLSGADLVAAVPGLADVCNISARSPVRVPGASLGFAHIAKIAAQIDEAARQGEEGFVVVQGTDTIEETAFLLDCLVKTDRPVAVTGAMRGANAAGADGPGNILSAATYAASKAGVGAGVVVVFNEEVHAARHVRKADTGLLSAFTSAPFGPIGRLDEGRVHLTMRPTWVRPHFTSALGNWPPVALVQLGFDDDGAIFEVLADLGYSGAVMIGLGAGHVPEKSLPNIGRCLEAMPVLLATRVPGGPVFTRTYGFAGSEIDLLAKGVIPTGDLGPVRARLLLQLALASNTPRGEIAQLFEDVR